MSTVITNLLLSKALTLMFIKEKYSDYLDLMELVKQLCSKSWKTLFDKTGEEVHIVLNTRKVILSTILSVFSPERSVDNHTFWLLSPNGIDYVRHRPTSDSKKQFTGLKPGRWYVQHQCILANGKDGPFLTLYIDLI